MPNLKNDTLLETDESQYLLVDGTRTAASLVVEGSSASALLRVTQTGTGNALVVEDSANPDASPFVVDAAGQLGVGIAPGVKIDAYNSSTTTTVIRARNDTTTVYLDANNGYAYLNTFTNHPLLFGTNNVERMRIDSTGQVGIGGTPAAGRVLAVSKTLTGSTTSTGISYFGTIQSDVTANAYLFYTVGATQATTFTLSSLQHFRADQVAFGAGSTVSVQAGFTVGSSMTGATQNFGFYGDIPSGTSRYNLFMNGTAANYMAGRLGVGATLTSGAMAMVVNTTAADVGLIVRGAASQSGSLVSIQNSAASPLVTVASTGEFAVTSSTTSNAPFQINAGLSGATTAFASIIQSTIASSVTADASGYRTAIQTAAAAFTLTTLRHFSAGNATIGSTSAITNQIGFYAAGLSGASANYGFYGDVASGTSRWNLYMNGTADNYLAGNTGIGGPATANIKLAVTGGSTNSANPAIIVYGVSGSGTVSIFNDMGAGSYNSIVSAGSKGIIAAGANAATARASFVIAPWSDVDYGIRIEGGSTTNILHYGTAIFQPAAAASVAAVVKGRASQSANLQEWHNSAGSVVAYVAANGSSSFGTAADDAQAIIAGSVFS